jgi:hypothetical protein
MFTRRDFLQYTVNASIAVAQLPAFPAISPVPWHNRR